jgi:hypothetical protein
MTSDAVRNNSSPAGLLASGAIAGVLSFLGGYLLTYLLKAGSVSDLFTTTLGEAQGSGLSPPGDWQVVGWFFFQMHTVATETTLTAGSLSETSTTTGSVESWLLLVPIALLIAFGYIVARNADVRGIAAGAQAGATVTVGYAAVTVAAVFLSSWSESVSAFGETATVTVGPAVVTGILTAGVIYPLALGAVGGAVAVLSAP